MSKFKKLTKMQEDHMNDDYIRVGRDKIHESWFIEDTVDFWRHDRMYSTIKPVADFYKNANWLTVGDGRFGLDSFRLNKKYGVEVFPTDISHNMLAEGQRRGVINDFSVENVESLSFDDNSFDIVFCKDTYHHFARPYIALYEMLRVASEAVVLIEPLDTDHIVNVRPVYESAGNYVSSVSNREINKIVHAMDLGGMAYFKFNDSYSVGVEFEKADEQSELFKKIKNKIFAADRKGHFSSTATVIFKRKMDRQLIEGLVEAGFVIPEKHTNMYLKANGCKKFFNEHLDKEILIWGGGKIFEYILPSIPKGSKINCVDQELDGVVKKGSFATYKIMKPEVIVDLCPEIILIASDKYALEIKDEIAKIYSKDVQIVTFNELT